MFLAKPRKSRNPNRQTRRNQRRQELERQRKQKELNELKKQLPKIILDFYNMFFKHCNPQDETMKEVLSFVSTLNDEEGVPYKGTLGEGVIGFVQEWKPNSNSYAVKIIDLKDDNNEIETIERAVTQELKTQTKLYELRLYDRVNTVRFVHFSDENNIVYIIYDKLEKFTFENMKDITYKQFEEHCHYLIETQEILMENGMYHGDIHSTNIMKNKNGTPMFIDCCVTDKGTLENAVVRIHLAMLAYVMGSETNMTDDWVKRNKQFFTLNYTDKNNKTYKNKFNPQGIWGPFHVIFNDNLKKIDYS